MLVIDGLRRVLIICEMKTLMGVFWDFWVLKVFCCIFLILQFESTAFWCVFLMRTWIFQLVAWWPLHTARLPGTLVCAMETLLHRSLQASCSVCRLRSWVFRFGLGLPFFSRWQNKAREANGWLLTASDYHQCCLLSPRCLVTCNHAMTELVSHSWLGIWWYQQCTAVWYVWLSRLTMFPAPTRTTPEYLIQYLVGTRGILVYGHRVGREYDGINVYIQSDTIIKYLVQYLVLPARVVLLIQTLQSIDSRYQGYILVDYRIRTLGAGEIGKNERTVHHVETTTPRCSFIRQQSDVYKSS